MGAQTITMEDIEARQLELERSILDLSPDRLFVLADHLKVYQEGDGRLKVLRNVRRKVEEDLESAEDQSLVISQMIELIGQPAEKDQQSNSTEYAAAREELEQLKEQFNKTIAMQQKQLKDATDKLALLKATQTETTTEKEVLSTQGDANMWRREFKIMGSIGGEKDKLSFVGLMRQIDCGLGKGYKESDVIEAVIRSINPNSKLKSYLEIMKDITLQKLCQILRVHYQEKNASELYQELTSIVQGTKESPQDFLLRALSLRERVIFASKADDKGMQYDECLVHSLFQHAFETGLRDETIRSKIRDTLHTDGVADEELMGSLNKIVSIEEERQNKLRVSTSKATKEFRVNSLNTATGNADVTTKPSTKHENASLLTTLEALQAQVTELNAKFEASRRANYVNNTPRQARRKCQSCQDANKDQCNHCFKCGSTDHMARGCKQSGNGHTLSPRDRR